MQLEVLTEPARGRKKPVPLLFIHGIFSCARIWSPFFQPFFAEHGYTSYAVSLRGHGGSDGRRQLWRTRLRDYLDDIDRVIDQIGQLPVLVGTSMGGVLVQHYLQRRSDLPGAVLLASGPPHGMMPSAARMAIHNPMLVWDLARLSIFGPRIATVDTARRALFRPETSNHYIGQYLAPPQPESVAVMWDVMALDLPPMCYRGDTPVLVMGAERDAFVSPGAVRLTARSFGVEAQIFPGMTHAMMLDEDWQQVAEGVLGWLNSR